MRPDFDVTGSEIVAALYLPFKSSFSPHPQTCHTRNHNRIEYSTILLPRYHRVLQDIMVKGKMKKRAACRKVRELAEAGASAQAKPVQATKVFQSSARIPMGFKGHI
jgi:hypothetical protein